MEQNRYNSESAQPARRRFSLRHIVGVARQQPSSSEIVIAAAEEAHRWIGYGKESTSGLPGKGAFHHYIEETEAYFQEMRQHEQRRQIETRGLAAGYVDVANFGELNNTFGHQRGDRMLHVVGDILRHSIREQEGDVVFQIHGNGDEFAIGVPIRVAGAYEAVTAQIPERVSNRLAQIQSGNVRPLHDWTPEDYEAVQMLGLRVGFAFWGLNAEVPLRQAFNLADENQNAQREDPDQ